MEDLNSLSREQWLLILQLIQLIIGLTFTAGILVLLRQIKHSKKIKDTIEALIVSVVPEKTRQKVLSAIEAGDLSVDILREVFDGKENTGE